MDEDGGSRHEGQSSPDPCRGHPSPTFAGTGRLPAAPAERDRRLGPRRPPAGPLGQEGASLGYHAHVGALALLRW